MLKYTEIDVVCSEIPGEISLSIFLSNCPHKCKGCHMPELRENVGTELTTDVLNNLIKKNAGVTCILFMGGDSDLNSLKELAASIMLRGDYPHATAWYTGLNTIPQEMWDYFDYIKIGEYIEELGPLTSKRTNQKLYQKEYDKIIDITKILQNENKSNN